MALAVDRFDFLAKEILPYLSCFTDTFAALGAAYTIKKTITLSLRVLSVFKIYGLSRIYQPNLKKKYGPWAVVTGSTHGIGKAYAQELASHGINIIVVSIGEKDCCSTSQLLERKFNVKTHSIAVDFNEGREIYDRIRDELQQFQIGMLVNNVGVSYDFPQYFLDVPEEKLWQMMHVNVETATMMTHIVLPQMVNRGRGAVVTVAGAAASLPMPQMAVYSATKAYLDSFSRSLNYEYKHHGVTVQCLMPYYVATRMTQYSSTLSNPSLWIPTAATYAHHALATLGWSNRTTGYWPHAILFWLTHSLPERVWLWFVSRVHSGLRRQAQQRSRHRSGSKKRQNKRPPGSVPISPSSSVSPSDETRTAMEEKLNKK